MLQCAIHNTHCFVYDLFETVPKRSQKIYSISQVNHSRPSGRSDSQRRTRIENPSEEKKDSGQAGMTEKGIRLSMELHLMGLY
jgi:hypothetical protein